MRVNVYAEELTERVQIITKTTDAGKFTGLRFFLELPISVHTGAGHGIFHRGPFIRPNGDDDSSAVTFWGQADLRPLLRRALAELDKYYDRGQNNYQAQGVPPPGQYEGNVAQYQQGAGAKVPYPRPTTGDPNTQTVEEYLATREKAIKGNPL